MDALRITLFTYIAIMLASSRVLAQTPVEIPDPAFREIIRQAIFKPTGIITTSDLDNRQFTSLSAVGAGIHDIRGIEHCKHLRTLVLSDNVIDDITPLLDLTKLHTLNLSGNDITLLGALAGMEDLHVLDLSDNLIPSVLPLQDLTNLRKLFLGSNQIADLAPIAGLSELWSLDLSANAFTDLSPLIAMDKLAILNISDNAIDSLNPITGLPSLVSLRVAGTSLIDTAPFASMPSLVVADLDRNPLADLTGLENSSELFWLGLNGTGLAPSAVNALLNPVSLDVLSLSSNDITEVTDLIGFGDLESIVLKDNPLTDDALCIQIPQIFAGGADVVTDFPNTDDDYAVDQCDNCPFTRNNAQSDDDGDSVGDACDACPGFDDSIDVNGDGIPDDCEPEPREWFEFAGRDPLRYASDTFRVILAGSSLTLQGPTNGIDYHWTRDGIRLSQNANVRGVYTPTLTINSVSVDNSGVYELEYTELPPEAFNGDGLEEIPEEEYILPIAVLVLPADALPVAPPPSLVPLLAAFGLLGAVSLRRRLA